MKKRKDLVLYLKSHGLRMTDSKKILLQFFLDNQNRNITTQEIQNLLKKALPEVDRTTIYRNIEKFLDLGIIQEFNLGKNSKVYQYIFDKQAHHYCICRSCGKTIKGDSKMFDRIESFLKKDHAFMTANLSLVFYGTCADCDKNFR